MGSSSNLNLIFFLLIIFSSLWSTSCHAASSSRDTLRPGYTLNSTSFLVFSEVKFTLGFLVNDKSNSSYLVLWRNASINQAWLANRNTPILYPSGVLTLDNNNTLKITHKGGDPIQICSASEITNHNVVAILLDSGNFILQQVNSDGSTKRVLWQSFDHPTDTLLPGMKLGMNHRNGHIWSLSSCSSQYSTAPGPFTLDWDPNEHELKIRQRGLVYWASGALKNKRFKFILADDDSKSKLLMRRYNFSFVSNENEDYFTYSGVNNQTSSSSEWLLTSIGRLHDIDGGVDIARADDCYGYNTDGGCQKWDQPICRHVGDRFELKNGFFQQFTSSVDNSTSMSDSNTSLSISDCRDSCWKNCDCLGFNFLFDNQAGCQFWNGNWKFIEDLVGDTTSSIYFLTTKSSRNNGDTKKTIIWIVTGIAAALLVIVLCIVCYLLRRRKYALSGENRTKIENELLDLMKADRPTDANGLQNDGKMGHDLSVFSYASVMAATSNFSKENKLGQGGFGPVYKGKLVTGREIAVKRLSKCSGGALEFKNELILVYELQHTNLVKLFGFCIHGEERMLIYEYMPNKSLDYFLFDSTRVILLDWKKRYSIIEGISQGLLYLHKYSRVRVIHRDLKASNILLDENMNPKISDFGMARIFTHNELEANTNRVVGTYGYMSPEYAMEATFFIKSNVYSFGVLLLESISGKRNNSFYYADRLLNIVGYAWELWKECAGLELLDPTLGNSCIKDQFLRCIHVGLLCVEENAADRPTMSDVVSLLTNESMPHPFPLSMRDNDTKSADITKADTKKWIWIGIAIAIAAALLEMVLCILCYLL